MLTNKVISLLLLSDYPQEYEIEQAFFDWNMNKGIVLEGLPETTLVNLE